MALDEGDELVSQMEAIRRQGVRAAQRLNHDLIRLTDWREHVRSSPILFVVAAAAVGYLIVPRRRLENSPPVQTRLEQTGGRARPAVRLSAAGQAISGLKTLALSLASRWAKRIVSDFVGQQLRSAVEQQDDRIDRRQAHRNGSRSID